MCSSKPVNLLNFQYNILKNAMAGLQCGTTVPLPPRTSFSLPAATRSRLPRRKRRSSSSSRTTRTRQSSRRRNCVLLRYISVGAIPLTFDFVSSDASTKRLSLGCRHQEPRLQHCRRPVLNFKNVYGRPGNSLPPTKHSF